MSVNSSPILELRNISKSFPGVKALDNVSLAIDGSSVMALVGENGAGKSTLIKIITGVYPTYEGTMLLYGQKVKFNNPRDAFNAGISVVHQERNLIDTFTIAENIFLERITDRATRRINMKPLYEEAEKYLDMIGLKVSPKDGLANLKAGQKQLLEIARALSRDAKIIMLDEPTASTSIKESEELLEIIDRLRSQGYTFIYVSHKLEEVFRIADKICVLRDGKNAGEIMSRPDFDRDTVIKQMIGRVERKTGFGIRDKSNEPVVLEAKNIASKHTPKPVSFKLHRGAVLGWYGLVGAGRTEIAREIIGVDPICQGVIELEGKPVRIRNTKDSLNKYGIAYISEDRNKEGLFLIHSIKTNISSSIWKRESRFFGFVDTKEERRVAEEFIRKLEIKTPSFNQMVMNLSGGNRQKVSMAKGMATKPKVLVFDEPTVGIDIKSKEEIHSMILELAESGISVIVISSDMDEIIRISDHILVFNDGEIYGELHNTKNYSEMSCKIMNMIMKSEESSESPQEMSS